MSAACRIRLGRGRLPWLARSFDSVLSSLRDGEDEVAGFITFDSFTARAARPFPPNLAELKDALSTFEPFVTTIAFTMRPQRLHVVSPIGGRPIHKPFSCSTDGVDTDHTVDRDTVSGLAISIDVPGVRGGEPFHRWTHESGWNRLRRILIRLTWRRICRLDGRTARVCEHVHESVVSPRTSSTIFSLAIRACNLSGNGPEWRRLDIRVKRASAVVKPARGYFVG